MGPSDTEKAPSDRQYLSMETQRIQSELAFNLNGDPFELDPAAVAFRARKMKHKGAPEVAYGRNGQPLVLPLEADVDDLRAEVTSPGRYRLDQIDANHRPIEGAQAGYVYVHDLARPVEAAEPVPQAGNLAPLPSPSDSVVIEAMRMNAEIARAVVCKLPMMFEAGAQLLRAADGAGLPARPPAGPYVEGDDDEDEDEAPVAPASPLNELFTQLAKLLPVAAAVLSSGNLPGLGEMFDWRKAAGAREPSTTKVKAIASGAVATTASSNAATNSEVPPITPQRMAHFFAIQAALSPDEAAIAREVAGGLSADERRTWLDELSALSVADAVTKIRTLIGATKETAS